MSKLTIEFPNRKSRREFCLWLCNFGEQEYSNHLALSGHEKVGSVLFNFFDDDDGFVGNLNREEIIIKASRPKEK